MLRNETLRHAQRLERQLADLRRDVKADAEAIRMYLNRQEPNIEAALRMADRISDSATP